MVAASNLPTGPYSMGREMNNLESIPRLWLGSIIQWFDDGSA
jgi:hypothetical protein